MNLHNIRDKDTELVARARIGFIKHFPNGDFRRRPLTMPDCVDRPAECKINAFDPYWTSMARPDVEWYASVPR